MALRENEPETTEQWEEFFTNKLKVSKDISQQYAAAFADEGYDGGSIKHLLAYSTPGIPSPSLLELGVKAGHCLKLSMYFNPPSAASNTTTHDAAPSTSTSSQNRPHVRHQSPQLQPSMSTSSFRDFISHWEVYRNLVGIPSNGSNTAAQMFSLACNDSPEIRSMIANHNPNHLMLPEKDYIEMLRRLLTAQATPEIYRNKFFSMMQMQGETCQNWLKRLKEIAPDCDFMLPCSKSENTVHSFGNTLLRTKFIMGTYNVNVKKDLLTKSSDLPTLDDVFNHASRMEATTKSMAASEKLMAEIQIEPDLPSSSEDEEIGKLSSYRQSRKPTVTNSSQRHQPRPGLRVCIGCGSNQHTSEERVAKCPAWKKTCNNCGRRGHFNKVCRSKKATDCANAVIALVSAEEKVRSNQLEITVTPNSGRKANQNIKINVLPDTGATLCVAGLYILGKLGLNRAHLKQTDKSIVTATGGEISCEGWIPLRMSVSGRSTTQGLYVCSNIRKTYLSKSGCIALGVIHTDFPKPLNTHQPILPKSNQPSPDSSVNTIFPVRPPKIPFPPTPENIPRLKDYLLTTFAKTAFNNDKTGIFPKMLGVPKALIHVKPDAKPFCRTTPNQVPHFWRNGTKKLIDQCVQRGMIRKTPIGTPTPWCSPMVITPKKSSSAEPNLRMTVDLQHLNSQCIRELHHVESPFNLASQIPKNTYKTLLDAVDGYQAIELAEESQLLTNFITHWGCFHFLRVPAGLIDSGDKYTSRYDSIIQSIQRKVKCVDDTLLYDESIEEAFYHTFEYLDTCARHGIVLNSSKFRFCQQEIDFAGFRITPTGIRPSDSTLKAIQGFPTPKSTTDVRSWFGLVRQVAFAHSVSEDLAPFRGLLKHSEGEKPKFFWNAQLQRIFDESKERIVKSVTRGIEIFDHNKYTCLQCDYSKHGIGFILMQKHCNCDEPRSEDETPSLCCNDGWKVVYAGSRFCNDAESRYAPTEGEALAVAWALKTSRLFTLGCPRLTVVTDHKPLLGIFNGRDLGSIKNPRIRRIKEHTLDYRFDIKHCPGKFHVGADALSRHPTQTHTMDDQIAHICESSMESSVFHALANVNYNTNHEDEESQFAALTREKVELACMKDPEYMQLLELVQLGFPSQLSSTPSFGRAYWPLAQKGMLSTFGNIIMYQNRIVIPKALRTHSIRVLHSAHQGCTGMIARANDSIYWPGIRKSILNHQTNCRTCLETSPSHAREPLQLTPLPERPFQTICSDLFQLKGHHYLIIVDRFSGFIHIYHSKSPPTHRFIITHMRDIFVRYGRPEVIETDGGPQYQSEGFQNFLNKWGVKQRISSPYYAQSNGRSELGVKSAKRMLRDNVNDQDGTIDNDKVACAVLQYHNTPMQNSPMSPAQLLFGRRLADFLPANPKAYALHPYWTEGIQKHQLRHTQHNAKLAQRYNRGTRELRPLQVGQTVAVQDQQRGSKRWNRAGEVVDVLPHRQYKVHLHDTGTTLVRNRRFLKATGLTQTHESSPYAGPLTGPASQLPARRKSVPSSETPNAPWGEDHRESPAQETHDARAPEPRTNPIMGREPLALRRLRPYNNPGLNEL